MIEEIEARMANIFSVTHRLDVACPFDPQDDGSYLFAFSRQARSTSHDGRTIKQYPKLYDAKGSRLAKCYRISLNSPVRVTCGFNHEYRTGEGFTPGVSLELLSVQIARVKSV